MKDEHKVILLSEASSAHGVTIRSIWNESMRNALRLLLVLNVLCTLAISGCGGGGGSSDGDSASAQGGCSTLGLRSARIFNGSPCSPEVNAAVVKVDILQS